MKHEKQNKFGQTIRHGENTWFRALKRKQKNRDRDERRVFVLRAGWGWGGGGAAGRTP